MDLIAEALSLKGGGGGRELKIQTDKFTDRNGRVYPDAGYDVMSWVDVYVPQGGGTSDEWKSAPALASVSLSDGFTADLIKLNAPKGIVATGYDEWEDDDYGPCYDISVEKTVSSVYGLRIMSADTPVFLGEIMGLDLTDSTYSIRIWQDYGDNGRDISAWEPVRSGFALSDPELDYYGQLWLNIEYDEKSNGYVRHYSTQGQVDVMGYSAEVHMCDFNSGVSEEIVKKFVSWAWSGQN